MKVQTSLQKKRAWTILLSSVVFALLPSMAFSATNLALPVSPSNPYDLTTLADGNDFKLFGLNTTYANAWCVLNPELEEDETNEQALEIDAEVDDTTPYLSFKGLNLSSNAFLALRIGTIESGDYKPYALRPKDDDINKIVPRALVITTRFEPSVEPPSFDLLKNLYFSFEDSKNLNSNVVVGAAKLGICVDDDGYFYIARVVASSELSEDSSTQIIQELKFEWAQTKVAYMNKPANPVEGVTYVGNGRVDVKVESYAFRAEEDQLGFSIAYRLLIKSDVLENYVSLSNGLGYTWAATDASEGAYAIDFESIGNGEWLFPIDAASVGTIENTLDAGTLDTLNMVGFSATAGGLYKVVMEEGTPVADVNTLSTYNIGQFATYGVLTSPTFSLFSDWINRYKVTLENHLSKTTSTRSVNLLSAVGATTTEETFNAFLLDMDPKLDVVQKLHVLSIVPDGEKMVLTVAGPEGCSLKNATARAGRLYVKRAATIEGLSSEESVPVDTIVGATMATDGDHLCVTLPRQEDNIDLPFVQVTLEAIDIEINIETDK